MTRRALVVSATDLLARGFHTGESDRASGSGEPTGALYSVAGAIERAIGFKQPDLAVAVIDEGADESEWPPLLAAQSPRLAELLEVHGLTAVRSARAADLVASYTRAALEAGCDVVVAGSDKRFAQLVGEQVWWYDAYKDVRYTPQLVRKRFEVGPGEVAGWLALVGDREALPGIKGIGKKGATQIIEAHGSVAAAVASADDVAGRAGKALRASLEEVGRQLERAHLDDSLALPRPLEELEYRAPPRAAVRQLYLELGFVELLSAEADDVEVELTVAEGSEEVAEALAAFDAEAPLSIAALTEDPSPVRGALAGVALAQRGRAVYVPLPEGAAVPAPLAAVLADPARAIVGHDTKAAAVALARRGVEVRGVAGDAACASHLAEPSNWAPHDLAVVARHVLARALPSDDAVRGVGKRRKPWSRVPADRAAGYAARVADAAEKVWAALEPDTDPGLLAEYLALSETLVRMELFGIACDRADLERAGVDFERLAAELEAEIYELAGKSLNLGSTKQLGQVLFGDLGLPVVKRTKTGWSTATEALEAIEHAHPIVGRVIRWRRLRRLMDSWVKALAAAIGEDGRVHATLHPARSFSGRLVCSSPDLGRVPGRTAEMARIRHAFRAPAGTTLLSVDYAQLGLYVLAHLSRDPALIEPLSGKKDMHVMTAAAVLDRDPDDIDDEARQLGKVINFATFAGQGASALALQLGVTAAEAKELIERFDRRYAAVRRFQDEQLELAQTRGWIETLAGRRWPIGGLSSLDPMERSYAERLARRATHEGSVADVSRRGLLRADQALRAAGLAAAPLLQVHDEVLFEVPDGELEEAAHIAAEAMRGAFDLAVPLEVGCEAGPSWAELEALES